MQDSTATRAALLAAFARERYPDGEMVPSASARYWSHHPYAIVEADANDDAIDLYIPHPPADAKSDGAPVAVPLATECHI